MLYQQTEQMLQRANLQSALDCALDQALRICGADFGNVQLMNWSAGYLEIKAQRGFLDQFLNFFKQVRIEDGSACARALRNRDGIVIEDIMADEQFLACRDVVHRAGIRAVQSTPLISSSGALLGVVSTHFPEPHRPSGIQMRSLREIAQLAADAIIRIRANAKNAYEMQQRSLISLEGSRVTIADADKLLARAF